MNSPFLYMDLVDLQDLIVVLKPIQDVCFHTIFMKHYREYVRRKKDSCSSVKDVISLSFVMFELQMYHKNFGDSAYDYFFEQFLVGIVEFQYSVLIKNFIIWSSPRDTKQPPLWDWVVLSPLDWHRIFDAVPLLSNKDVMREQFGNAIYFFKTAMAKCEIYMQRSTVDQCFLCTDKLVNDYVDGKNKGKSYWSYCKNCKWSFANGKDPTKCTIHQYDTLDAEGYCKVCERNYRRCPAPMNQWFHGVGLSVRQGKLQCDVYRNQSMFVILSSLSDKKQIGHVSWVFCQIHGLMGRKRKRDT
jgi:hypothetical protein